MENLCFEELNLQDIDQNYLDILNELSDTSDITVEGARKTYIKQIANKQKSFCLKKDGVIIGIVSTLIDYKIAHKKPAIHIEDVAIRKDFQGKGCGKFLIDQIKTLYDGFAYKIILDCSQKNVAFYKKCGFIQTCFTMRYDWDD